MINLEILLFGNLREIIGVRKTGAVLNDGSRLADLVEHLTSEYGQEFRDQLDSITGLRILINGREYFLTGHMESPLSDGDTVVFLPPIAGG